MPPASFAPPKWLTNLPLPVAPAVLCDPDAAARQEAEDAPLRQVVRDLVACDRPDIGVAQRVLHGAMWTQANFNIVIDGRPLLHHVVDCRDVSALLLLISGGREKEKFVRREDTDQLGRTALDHAQVIGWEEGAHYLRLYGFTIGTGIVSNAQTQLDCALVQAVRENDVCVARAACALGACPDAVMPDAGMSVFHYCVMQLQAEMVALLAGYGAVLNEPGPAGATALHLLWQCRPAGLLSESWYAMADVLRAAGCVEAGFKTPREMSGWELTQEPSGAPAGARAMDYALAARDFDLYRRGLSALGGPAKVAVLLSETTAVRTTPLRDLCRRGLLHEVLRAELWYGQGADLRRLWLAARDELARPSPVWQRQGIAASLAFVQDDFLRLIAQVDLQAIGAGARHKFKL